MDVGTIIKNPPFKLTDEDIRALRGQSEDFKPHTWDQVKGLIAAGEMGQLSRAPRDLRNYIMWLAEVSKTHGSVLEFVRRERLHWPEPIVARNAVPFAHADDWKTTWNDWPYGLEDGMMHLVVWSKAKIPVDPETGLPTEQTARLIEGFLDRIFGEALGVKRGQDLVWFRQKAAWQSVKALDHIHVLLRNAPQDRVEELLGQQRSRTLSVLAADGVASTGKAARAWSRIS